MMTPRQRVSAVLAGRRPDHPPVSCWYHFPPEQAVGPACVDAHLRHLEIYRLDFLKVMNDVVFPRGRLDVLQTAADLARIEPLPGDAGGLGGQIDVVRTLRERIGADVMMSVTLFNPWALLRYLTRPPSVAHNPPKMNALDDRDDTIARLLKEDRPGVQAALLAIARTQAAFAALCLQAGADGVFLSVRDDWVDTPANGEGTYDALARPADELILAAADRASFNILHICGRPLNFKRFADYPVHVLHWADRVTGPSIAYAATRVRPAIAGGVDNLATLPEGTPEQVAAEVRDALRQAGDRPILIAPGCTFDPAVPSANLHAMIQAAHGDAA